MLLNVQFNLIAQYDNLGLYDALIGSNYEEDNNVCDFNGRFRAISRQWRSKQDPNLDGRTLMVYDNSGTYIAQLKYSHDRDECTKILFDPTNEYVVYAVYIERELDVQSSPYKTYLKRMVINPSLGTISEGPRKEVFYSNYYIFNFVIASNGHVLIGAAQSDGSVRVNAYLYANPQMSLVNSFLVGAPGVADYDQFNTKWDVSMDIKDDIFILGHNTGPTITSTDVIIKKYLYQSGNLSLLEDHYLNNHRLHPMTSLDVYNKMDQNIALKPTGEIFYLNSTDIYGSWQLVKLSGGVPAIMEVLQTGDGHANIVASENGKSVLAYQNNSDEYEISQYTEYDGMEHVHIVSEPLRLLNGGHDGINNVAMHDCEIMVCGKDAFDVAGNGTSISDIYYELYSCSDCDESGEPTAAGQFENFENIEYVNTVQGLIPIPVYCRMGDVIFNGMASSCEDKYFLEICEVDPFDLNCTNLLYGDLIMGTVPHNLNISDYVTLPYDNSIMYRVRVTVLNSSPVQDYIELYFKTKNCKFNKEMLSITGQSYTVEVYPNPSTGALKIGTNQNIATSYQIVDIFGRVVSEGEFVNSIDLNLNLKSGAYFLNVENVYEHTTKKIIIE